MREEIKTNFNDISVLIKNENDKHVLNSNENHVLNICNSNSPENNSIENSDNIIENKRSENINIENINIGSQPQTTSETNIDQQKEKQEFNKLNTDEKIELIYDKLNTLEIKNKRKNNFKIKNRSKQNPFIQDFKNHKYKNEKIKLMEKIETKTLLQNIDSSTPQFADDIVVITIIYNESIIQILQKDLNKILNYMIENQLILNPQNSEHMRICFKNTKN